MNTHAAAADEDDAEALQHAGRPHHPGQAQEEDDAEDVLEARQVHAHEGAHLRRLQGGRSRNFVILRNYLRETHVIS